ARLGLHPHTRRTTGLLRVTDPHQIMVVGLPADRRHPTAVLMEARLLLMDARRPRMPHRLTVGQCHPMAARVRQRHRLAAGVGRLYIVLRVAADRQEVLAAEAAAGLAVEAAEAMSHLAEA